MCVSGACEHVEHVCLTWIVDEKDVRIGMCELYDTRMYNHNENSSLVVTTGTITIIQHIREPRTVGVPSALSAHTHNTH